MPDESRFQASYTGIGQMLRMPEMIADMARRAEQVMNRAIGDAPIDHDPDDKHRGRYKQSFSTESGDRGDRAYGRVTNTAPEAVDVEYGGNGTPKYRTLGRAMTAAGEG